MNVEADLDGEFRSKLGTARSVLIEHGVANDPIRRPLKASGWAAKTAYRRCRQC
jgi:hypothetical protein